MCSGVFSSSRFYVFGVRYIVLVFTIAYLMLMCFVNSGRELGLVLWFRLIFDCEYYESMGRRLGQYYRRFLLRESCFVVLGVNFKVFIIAD